MTTSITTPQRRKSRLLPCEGRCGKAACDHVAESKSNLQNHINAGLGKKPYKCGFCDGCRFTRKDKLAEHVRNVHKDKCAADESCAEMGIGPKRAKPLFMPPRFERDISKAEWGVLKQMVTRCAQTDREEKYADCDPDNNEMRHERTAEILDVLLARGLLDGTGTDDAGGRRALNLRTHGGLFKLSLDRKNNGGPHFRKGVPVTETLNFVPLALNHKTNPVNKHGADLCAALREERKEPGGDVESALERERKRHFPQEEW